MTKVPTIFEKSDRPGFFANLDRGGKIQRVKLGNTLAEATIALGAELEKLADPAPTDDSGVLTLSKLIDRWLAYIKQSQSAATLTNYTRYAGVWKALHGELPAASITPDHVSECLRDKYTKTSKGKPFSDSCRWQFEKVALGLFKWSVKRQLLTVNPLLGYDRATVCGKRKSWISQAQYDKLIAGCTDQNLRDLLETFWRSGARPFELFQLEARHYDAQGRRLILKRAKGDKVKARKKERDAVRIITLGSSNDTAARLAAENPTGKLFRNRDREWTIATAGRGLAKLAEFTAVKANGGPLSLYTLRHSYASRMAKVISIDELRKLMGHKDTRQLESLYDHSGDDADYMDGLARRAG
jgi:site-specific recombinase XerD